MRNAILALALTLCAVACGVSTEAVSPSTEKAALNACYPSTGTYNLTQTGTQAYTGCPNPPWMHPVPNLFNVLPATYSDSIVVTNTTTLDNLAEAVTALILPGTFLCQSQGYLNVNSCQVNTAFVCTNRATGEWDQYNMNFVADTSTSFHVVYQDAASMPRNQNLCTRVITATFTHQ
jgi:hypothetical protein